MKGYSWGQGKDLIGHGKSIRFYYKYFKDFLFTVLHWMLYRKWIVEWAEWKQERYTVKWLFSWPRKETLMEFQGHRTGVGDRKLKSRVFLKSCWTNITVTTMNAYVGRLKQGVQLELRGITKSGIWLKNPSFGKGLGTIPLFL